MTNEEYLLKWGTHSKVTELSFDQIYSVPLMEDGETISDFLDFVHIDKQKLIESTNPKINQSLDTIDELLLQSTEEIRVFVVDNLFGNTDDEVEFLSNYRFTKSQIYENYELIQSEIVSIRSELEK